MRVRLFSRSGRQLGTTTADSRYAEDRGSNGLDANVEIQRKFWLRHIRIGFGVFLSEALIVMLYLGVTPRGLHRIVLFAIVASWFAFSVFGLVLARSIAQRGWRHLFSASWTIVAAFAVGGVASLDGGLDSPTVLLLFLPVAYAALAFSTRTTATCGAATLVCLALVAGSDPDIRLSVGQALLLSGVLAGASVLSISAAANRTRREHHERQLTRQIAGLATVDDLTGCSLRRVFRQRLAEEIARSIRHGHPLSLMMIDMDKFKSVNDAYGHLVGDHVLAGVGATLLANVRTFDLVGRLGGDEFAVLMPETEPETAAALAERIRRATASTAEVSITLSIGVSDLDRSTPSVGQILADADLALYHVKGAGGDGVAVRCSGPSGSNGPVELQKASSQ